MTADTLDRFDAYAEPPSKLEYRADGQQLAVATNTNNSGSVSSREFDPVPVLLVDSATLEEQPVQLGGLPGGQVEARDLHYSADGRFLAVSLDRYEGNDITTSVLVWDVAFPEQPVQRIDPGQVWAVALSPDGSMLYVGTHDPPALTAHEVATGRVVRTLGLPPEMELGSPGAASAADGLEVSPDGATLAVQNVNEIVLLDGATLAERGRQRGHTELVTMLQFSHDGALLASGSDDRRVLVWDVATGTPREQLRGHTGSVSGLAFSPDNATLYSASVDRRLLAWDVRGERRLVRRTGLVDLSSSAASTSSYEVLAVPAPDGEVVAYLGVSEPGSEWGDTIRFLDVAAGRLGDPIVTGRSNWGPTWKPPDWEQFATTSGDGYVRVWDWRRGELLAERQVAADIADISYTADGGRILVGERSGTVFQIDADTLEPVGANVQLDQPIRAVVASPDGRTAIALHEGASIASIDLVDGRTLYSRNLGFGTKHADISPDGRLVAIVCESGEVGLLDVETGAWVSPPALNGDAVERVAYALDGATFASSGNGDRVSLWDGRTGALLGTVLPGQATRAAVEFLPDAHTVVIATLDGGVYTWDTRPESWIDYACVVAGRNLTKDEWSDAFGDRPYRETCSTS